MLCTLSRQDTLSGPSIFGYSEGLDSAPPHSPDRPFPSPSPEGVETLDEIQTPQLQLKELSGIEVHDLWREAEADSVGLGKDELATVLVTLGVKYNYGQPPGTEATRSQVAAFWRSLQLRDLALAHACALRREPAWQQLPGAAARSDRPGRGRGIRQKSSDLRSGVSD